MYLEAVYVHEMCPFVELLEALPRRMVRIFSCYFESRFLLLIYVLAIVEFDVSLNEERKYNILIR